MSAKKSVQLIQVTASDSPVLGVEPAPTSVRGIMAVALPGLDDCVDACYPEQEIHEFFIGLWAFLARLYPAYDDEGRSVIRLSFLTEWQESPDVECAGLLLAELVFSMKPLAAIEGIQSHIQEARRNKRRMLRTYYQEILERSMSEFPTHPIITDDVSRYRIRSMCRGLLRQ